MKRILSFLLLFAALFVNSSNSIFAQQQQVASSPAGATMPQAEVDRIIRSFSAKETEFQRALNQYGFKRDAVIQTIGMGGQISGEYRRVSRFVMDDTGKRFEKILLFPMPTITDVTVTTEDLEDLGGVNAFALESSQIAKYNFAYVGKERIDELDVHIFDVAPKVMPDPKKKERLFQGRIWVDDQDLQIVKARGKGVPDAKNSKYPTFETYREQIDGRFWFPTYTFADDELVFGSGQVVRMRMRVKYTDFEKLTGKVRVIEEGDPGVEEPTKKPAPAAAPSTSTPKP